KAPFAFTPVCWLVCPDIMGWKGPSDSVSPARLFTNWKAPYLIPFPTRTEYGSCASASREYRKSCKEAQMELYCQRPTLPDARACVKLYGLSETSTERYPSPI